MKIKLLSLIVMMTKLILYGTLLQVFVFTVLMAYDSNAQIESIKDKKIDLNLKNVSLQKALAELEKNTGYEFTYDRKIFNSNIKVDLVGENMKVYDYLLTLSKEANLRFKQYNNSISVSRNRYNYTEPPVVVVAQGRSVTGRVTSTEDNQGLPGVNVLIQGASQGTVTDIDGNYQLEVPGDETVLVFSSVGYIRQEATVGTRSVIDISMTPDVTSLEEIVVIGYGEQKKVNLTGSVGAVEGTELNKRPAPNVENLLQGRISGLQVTQKGGTPGDDNAEIRIRGLGTFSGAGSSPLVLIDGIQGDMSQLDPNNVESVSVLKDAASAAIYGARAANGVILVTTKRGSVQPVTIEYHVTLQAQTPTALPDLLTNSADYMELWNEANVRIGIQPYFPQADIDAYRNAEGTNDPRYPNFDWVDHMYSTAFVQNHHLSVNGGNEKTQFNLAAGYLNQPGIVPLFEFKRYNLLMSVDTKINNWISVGGNLQMTRKDAVRDIQSGYNDAYFIMHTFAPGPNYTPTMTLPDGTTGYVARYSSAIAEWTVRNPDAILAAGSRETTGYNPRMQLYTDINITKDLTWFTKGATYFDYSFVKNHEHAVDNYYFKDGTYAHNNGVWHLGVNDYMNTAFLTTLYSTLNYKKVFNSNHNLNVLAGYNQETGDYRSLNGARKYFPTDNLKELNAGSPLEQSTGGTASQWAIQSFFGRITYDFQGRYLFEANGRYDGTSRIAPDTRWGFFPSVSGGWRISEESFLSSSWLDNLKVRASWGQLGNQNVGTYPYQDVLSTTEYPFGTQQTGVQLTRLVDKSLKWETTTITDIGFDFSMKKGLLSLTVDWYDKITDDILYQVPVPASVGLSAPTVNGGKMKNTGWEFEVGHRNNIGEVTYGVNFNISAYKNEVLSILRPSYGRTTIQEGLPYNSWYLTEWIGIFQTQEEIDNAPEHPFNPKPGDLRFKDQNNDGVINSEDRIVFDGAFPDFYYGGSIDLTWKGFDVSAFFQGVSGQMSYVQNWGLSPFTQGSPPTMDLVNNRWTGPGSTNEYPAIYRGGSWSSYKPVEGTESTFHLENASYLRLKNLRIAYTVPTIAVEKIGLKSAQVYFSGDNLLTFTKYPGADPERVGGGVHFSVFPQLRTLALGIKVSL